MQSNSKIPWTLWESCPLHHGNHQGLVLRVRKKPTLCGAHSKASSSLVLDTLVQKVQLAGLLEACCWKWLADQHLSVHLASCPKDRVFPPCCPAGRLLGTLRFDKVWWRNSPSQKLGLLSREHSVDYYKGLKVEARRHSQLVVTLIPDTPQRSGSTMV